MVRGTYLPWPAVCVRRVRDLKHVGSRTSLGEEGAEAVVVVLSLALLSEVAVGLDAVLEAVELAQLVSISADWRSGTRHPAPSFFRYSKQTRGRGGADCRVLTSQQEFAIWQPAWPTRRVQSQHQQRGGPVPPVGGRPGCGQG